MRSRHVAGACLAGFIAAFAINAPAYAAAPTLTGPTHVVGYSKVTLTGTTTPGATVQLWENATLFAENGTNLEPSPDYGPEFGEVTTKADGAGKFTLHRQMDSGFWFAVHVGAEASKPVKVDIQQEPEFTITPGAANGTASVVVVANPGQPGLPATVARKTGSSTWTTVASGNVDAVGTSAQFSASLTGQPGGSQVYRATVGGDASNGVLTGFTERTITVAGPATPTTPPTTTPTTPPTTKPTTPPTTKPTTPPTKPTTPPATTKPPTPKPTTPPKPAPVPVPKAGWVQFTKAVYNPAGVDNGTTKSLNNEYVRLTNKTKKTLNLKNWTVRDKAGHVYKFTSTFYLGAGKSVVLHTGKGTNNSANKYWGRKGKSGYIWNNGGDTAYVRSYTGATIDSCKWGKGKGSTNC
jgi:Lamin Tail Domain